VTQGSIDSTFFQFKLVLVWSFWPSLEYTETNVLLDKKSVQ